jgi:rod shape-determining protein MreD
VQGPKLFIGLLVALVVHLLAMRLFPAVAGMVDLFLVAVVLNALGGNSLSALTFGFVAGLVKDALTHGPFGLFGFADTIVGYLTARLAQRLVIQRATGVLGVVALAAALETVIVIGLTLLLLPSPELPNPLWVAARSGACGVLGMAIHVASIHLRRGIEARRRGRMNRLRMG